MKKKRFFLVFVLAVFSMTQLNAQTRFGIKGGVGFEHYNYSKIPYYELIPEKKTNWQLGILYQNKLSAGFSLQPELLYVWHKSDDIMRGKVGKENDLHYFEFPLNVQWGPDLKWVRPFVVAGPYFGFAVHIHDDVLKSHTQKFDWGFGAGAGVDIWKLQFAARYSWGMKDLSHPKELDMKRNTFNLALAFLF